MNVDNVDFVNRPDHNQEVYLAQGEFNNRGIQNAPGEAPRLNDNFLGYQPREVNLQRRIMDFCERVPGIIKVSALTLAMVVLLPPEVSSALLTVILGSCCVFLFFEARRNENLDRGEFFGHVYALIGSCMMLQIGEGVKTVGLAVAIIANLVDLIAAERIFGLAGKFVIEFPEQVGVFITAVANYYVVRMGY